jgi:hypothetical protein
MPLYRAMPICQAFLKILRASQARSIPLAVLRGAGQPTSVRIMSAYAAYGDPCLCVVIELFFKVQ